MSIFQHTSEAKDTVDSRRAEYQATFAPDGKDYHKAKTDKDDELRRKIGAILNNTYLKKITFN